MRRRGAVIVFAQGVGIDKIQAAIDKMIAEGLIDRDYYVGGRPPVHDFNPEHGGPVWYIP